MTDIEERVRTWEEEIIELVRGPRVLTYLSHVLSDRENRELSEMYNMGDQAAATRRLLLRLWQSKTPGKWQAFITALESGDYPYLATHLKGESCSEKNFRYQKKIIEIFRPKLVDSVNAMEIVSNLVSLDVLSRPDEEQILARQDREGSMAAALVLLERIQCHLHPELWYVRFLQVLYDNQHGALVKLIDPDFYKDPARYSSKDQADNYSHYLCNLELKNKLHAELESELAVVKESRERQQKEAELIKANLEQTVRQAMILQQQVLDELNPTANAIQQQLLEKEQQLQRQLQRLEMPTFQPSFYDEIRAEVNSIIQVRNPGLINFTPSEDFKRLDECESFGRIQVPGGWSPVVMARTPASVVTGNPSMSGSFNPRRFDRVPSQRSDAGSSCSEGGALEPSSWPSSVAARNNETWDRKSLPPSSYLSDTGIQQFAPAREQDWTATQGQGQRTASSAGSSLQSESSYRDQVTGSGEHSAKTEREERMTAQTTNEAGPLGQTPTDIHAQMRYIPVYHVTEDAKQGQSALPSTATSGTFSDSSFGSFFNTSVANATEERRQEAALPSTGGGPPGLGPGVAQGQTASQGQGDKSPPQNYTQQNVWPTDKQQILYERQPPAVETFNSQRSDGSTVPSGSQLFGSGPVAGLMGGESDSVLSKPSLEKSLVAEVCRETANQPVWSDLGSKQTEESLQGRGQEGQSTATRPVALWSSGSDNRGFQNLLYVQGFFHQRAHIFRNIEDVVELGNGMVACLDSNRMTLFLFNTSYDKTAELELPGRPLRMCLFSLDQVAILYEDSPLGGADNHTVVVMALKMDDTAVQFVPDSSVRLTCEGSLLDVCCRDQTLYACCTKRHLHISLTSADITYQVDLHVGERANWSPNYMDISKDQKVLFVSEGCSVLSFRIEDGIKLWEYNDGRSEPQGVVHCHGFVYTVDRMNNRIIELTEGEGKPQRTLGTGHLEKPIAICASDRVYERVFVTQHAVRTVRAGAEVPEVQVFLRQGSGT